jgi:hypothetical protein
MIVSANQAIAIWGKGNDVIGKSLLEILPEIKIKYSPLLKKYMKQENILNNEIKCICITMKKRKNVIST